MITSLLPGACRLILSLWQNVCTACFVSSLIAIERVVVIYTTSDSPYLVDKLFQTARFRFGVDGNAGRGARFPLATALPRACALIFIWWQSWVTFADSTVELPNTSP